MYFILGLPRSRTTWLSCYLYSESFPTYHEKSSDFGSFDELVNFCSGKNGGVVDTALLTRYEDILEDISTKVVLVTKDIKDVRESVQKEGFPVDSVDYLIPYYEKCLSDDRVRKVDSRLLSDKDTLEDIHAYLGIPFEKDKFDLFNGSVILKDTPLFLEKVRLSRKDYSWLFGEKCA